MMKKIFVLCALALYAGMAKGQTAANAYTRTTHILKPAVSVSEVSALPGHLRQTTTVYADGLGRPIQTIEHGATQGGKDFVLLQAYNEVGLQALAYLPYAGSSADGRFQEKATEAQANFYKRSFNTLLEQSPLTDLFLRVKIARKKNKSYELSIKLGLGFCTITYTISVKNRKEEYI